MNLSICQERARKEFNKFLASDEQFFILTGGPGRGKTFMTSLLLEDIHKHNSTMNILSSATTNKAAKVVADFTGSESNTIHSLLGLRVRNNIRTGRVDLIRNPDASIISNSFIQIDEISMMDDQLLTKLDEGTVRCRFLLVGDKDQLAPINQSKPPIFYKRYTQCELVTPMRFGGDIGELAEQLKETINTGVFKPIVFNETTLIHLSGEEFKTVVDTKFHTDIAADELKIICWKNDTVRAYNDYIRGQHYDEEYFTIGETVVTNQPIMTKGIVAYSTDEFAIIIDVRPAIEHGINGYWYKLNRGCFVFQARDQSEVKLKMSQLANSAKAGGGWHSYFMAKEFFGDLRAVHACTSYKSQGSSYDTTFIDLDDIGACNNWEQVARQLYVAVTRAKRQVYFYGNLPKKYTNHSHMLTFPNID